ncbi:hypothetical protein FRC07_009133 [Ceratobasidium sp. 392]|nr:hypothetical protein FRC07_009133 [Ceratobasidium sp. 392]
MAASGAFVPPTDGLAQLSISGNPGIPTSRTKLKDKLSSNLDEFAKKVKPKFPDFAVFAATMTGLPIIREAVNGVQVMQDWTSCRQKLLEFQQKLERLLNTIETHSQDPGYMNVTMVEFKTNLESMLAQVRKESRRQPSSYFDSTTRLLTLIDKYEEQATTLVEEALVSGIFAQQNIVLPEEYDKTIPTLKSLHRGNGLVQKGLVRMERYDGGPVEHAPAQHLHVTTHQGVYKDTPVEIKEYFGGPEDQLLLHVKELVNHYQTFDKYVDYSWYYELESNDSSSGALLTAYPTVNAVPTLCSPQLTQVFDYLKIKKQMNWESIRIRSDGTLLIVPSTQGDNFLLSENVWDPESLPPDAPRPIKELCEFLQEADRQGITRDAIAALRAHSGPWDKIAVWKIAKEIDLRPTEQEAECYNYLPRNWKVHAGMIINLAYDNKSFKQLDMMPKQGLTQYDRAHLRQFQVIRAFGQATDGTTTTYKNDWDDGYLKRIHDGEWECIPWEQWRIILESCAKRRNQDIYDLAVITRTEGSFTLRKVNCPKLGTRPLYFFRKPDQVTATPREFWGFFSFNPDPNGPPGISIRVNPHGKGRLVSDSVEPDPEGWSENTSEVDFSVVWASMREDWDIKIQEELDRKRINPDAMFMEQDITWSDDEDEDDEVGWT